MPISKLICNKREAEVSFQECIECSKTNLKCDIFPEMVSFIKDEAEETSSELTITKLLFCPRRAYLLAKTEYAVQPEDMYSAIRGKMGHLIFEEQKTSDCISETRFYKEYKGVRISGQPDKIDIKNKILYDYKTTTGRISDDKTLRWGNTHLHHQVQINLYKWLVEPQFEINRLILIYIGSDCSKKIEVPIRHPDNKKLYKPIQDAFDKIEILGQYWNEPYSDEIARKIPEEKDEKNRWICRYCFVSKTCKRLNR